jgi:hypothetical protein
MNPGFDFSDLIKRAVKYITEGILVAICAYSIPKKKLDIEEVVIIGLSAAAVFSILDVFSPSIGASARGGAGFSIGSSLAGGVRLA